MGDIKGGTVKPCVWLSPSLKGEARRLVLPELRRIAGKASEEYIGPMILQEDDSRLQEIIALMNVHGVPLLPNDTQSRDIERSPIGYYQSQRIRGFDDSDFKSAEYLWLQELDGSGSDVDADGDRHADGLLPIMMNTVPRRGRLMSCGTDVFLVSDVFRSELEAERFAGMGFVPTRALKERKSGGTYVYEPFECPPERRVWELRPSVELPRMHREVLRVLKGRVLGPDETCAASFKNEGFDDVQLAYGRSSLASVGAFDLSRTAECRHGRDPQARSIIASQRFYQFCKAKKLPCRFVPLKIVEGE